MLRLACSSHRQETVTTPSRQNMFQVFCFGEHCSVTLQNQLYRMTNTLFHLTGLAKLMPYFFSLQKDTPYIKSSLTT